MVNRERRTVRRHDWSQRMYTNDGKANSLNDDLQAIARELNIEVEALESRLEMTDVTAAAAQCCTVNGGCNSNSK